jgi:hypothetical protein
VSGASWQAITFEDGDDLDESWPVTPGTGCSYNAWSLGSFVLALDAEDNPRIGYDARNLELCGGNVHTNYRLARYAQFDGP